MKARLHYTLRCPKCNARIEEDGLVLACHQCKTAALLKTEYETFDFEVDTARKGIFRFHKWLPISRVDRDASSPALFQSPKLSAEIGLENLWLAFSGYWPEKGAFIRTCSFKELEAHTVLARVPDGCGRILTVASAGNTAAAFLAVASQANVPCLVIVPEEATSRMQFTEYVSPHVKLVSITRGGYMDAIRLAERVTTMEEFMPEGGARNVARRDGLGALMLCAYEAMGVLPDFYFQAIGSGAGAIGVHEAAGRISKGQQAMPKLYLSQNAAFRPVYDAWHSGEMDSLQVSDEVAREQENAVYAPVLINTRAPYLQSGGLHDALIASDGTVLSITADEGRAAADLFLKCEGIDIQPAAAIGLASLSQAVSRKLIPGGSVVLLNLTGGGAKRLASERGVQYRSADFSVDLEAVASWETLQAIRELF